MQRTRVNEKFFGVEENTGFNRCGYLEFRIEDRWEVAPLFADVRKDYRKFFATLAQGKYVIIDSYIIQPDGSVTSDYGRRIIVHNDFAPIARKFIERLYDFGD